MDRSASSDTEPFPSRISFDLPLSFGSLHPLHSAPAKAAGSAGKTEDGEQGVDDDDAEEEGPARILPLPLLPRPLSRPAYHRRHTHDAALVPSSTASSILFRSLLSILFTPIRLASRLRFPRPLLSFRSLVARSSVPFFLFLLFPALRAAPHPARSSGRARSASAAFAGASSPLRARLLPLLPVRRYRYPLHRR